EGISDGAEPDAGGDGIGERHGDRGHHRRRIFGDVLPFDLGKPARHHAGDIKQRRRRGIGGNNAGQRGEEQRQQEEQRDEDGGQAGAAAGRYAGRALDIARGGRRADERAEHGGEAVGEQRLPHARQVAVRIEQTRAVGDADQRTGVVEHVDHQKAEYDDDEGQFRDAGEIELQEGRRERGRRRHDAREFGKPERQADQRHREDADQRGADDVAVIERDDHDETGETENRRPLLEIAERDQRRRVGDDDLGFLEGDDAEKEPDAGGDRQFEILRDRVDDVFA